MYLALAETFVNPLALFTIAIGIGILTRFIGHAGSIAIVPVLNIFGFPVSYAVGTSVAYLLGRSVIDTFRWGAFDNKDFRRGILLGLQTAAGVSLGKVALLVMADLNITGLPIRLFYILLLFGIGIHYARERTPFTLPARPGLHGLLPFMGLIAGILTGLTGVNAALLLIPGMLLFGLAANAASATAIIAVLVATCWGTFALSFGGRVEAAAVLLLLLGTTLGELLGAFLQHRVNDLSVRPLAGKFLVVAGASLLLKQFGLTTPGGYLLWGTSLLLVVYVCVRAAVGYRSTVLARQPAAKKILP
jgi:hypothetical protein